ncbi:nucleotidyltransferase domain-containing protein [Rufibacter roseus]|uniref:DNA polymerase beta superfamily protein n=1 Tax=Rufibacter roseus TaxID=1567108 RepID=A0ABW2DR48_9BACT|nr:nucleotidyltransferase domain-containing protein [Rufibacter roseus]
MEKLIQQKLQELETQNNITILFAIESGSRAWGFPSPDSDYDVRFVYQHQPDWYLSIDERKDTLESMDGDLDLVGWDLRKALRLLRKSNASIFEKMQSPIVYRQQRSFLEDLQAVAPTYFSCRAGLHHYLSMAFNYYKACAPEQNVKLKSYFYLLRTTLASRWIVEYRTMPPMLFTELLPLVEDPSLLQKIEELLTLKATVTEQYVHPKEEALEQYLYQTLRYCESKAEDMPKANGSTEALDTLFRKTVLDHGTLA